MEHGEVIGFAFILHVTTGYPVNLYPFARRCYTARAVEYDAQVYSTAEAV